MFFYLCCLLVLAAAERNHTDLNICPLITGHNYTCEEYKVLTSDGWYLKLQRIPPPKPTNAVVYFQHGLLDSAAGILLNGPPLSLPFILSDQGYDVWLGNNRGNKVSMENIHYTEDQPEFWDFSFDEMGSIDLPTMVNFILNQTKVSTLTYIGHSEGTTQALLGFTNTNLTDKVNTAILMAPIAYINHTYSPLLRFLAKYDVDVFFQKLGVMKFEFSDAFQLYLEEVCESDPTACYDGMEVLFGPSTHINSSTLPADVEYFPAATSMKNMAHWLQWVRSGIYDMYDYGTTGNQEHYGQATPPVYLVKNIPKSLKLALMTGGTDWLADPIDVKRLIQEYVADGRASPFIFTVSDYAHLDPVLAYDAYKLYYPTVLELIAAASKVNDI